MVIVMVDIARFRNLLDLALHGTAGHFTNGVKQNPTVAYTD